MELVDVIKEGIQTVKKEGASKSFTVPDIPEKKLNSAIKAICPEEKAEHIIGIIDTSLFGSGKDGIVFLGNSLYAKGMLEKVSKVNFEDIMGVTYQEEKIVDDKGKEKINYSLTIDRESDQVELSNQLLANIEGKQLEILLNRIHKLSGEEQVNFTNENQNKPLELMSDVIKMTYVKLLCNYAFEKDKVIDSAEYAELVSFMVKIKVKSEDRIALRAYMLEESTRQDTGELLEKIQDETSRVEYGIITKSLIKDLLILYKLSSPLEKWEEDSLLLAIISEFDVSLEEVKLLVKVIEHDQNIIDKRLNDTQIKKSLKEISAGAIAVGVPMAALYFSGTIGVSAAGMTSGLATLGFGGVLGFSSMLTGVGALALIGIGTYQGVKKFSGLKELENNKQREKMLQEIIRNSQKTLTIIIEDVNTISKLLIQEMRSGKETEVKIDKLVEIISMLTEGAEVVTGKINDTEIESVVTKIPKSLDIGRLKELTAAATLKEAQEFILACYSGEGNTIKEDISLAEIQDLNEILQKIGYLNLKEASIAKVKSSAKNLTQGFTRQ